MDLSFLILTCDKYLKFWVGMLFSLDFYWDYKSIPVYWSSEDLSIHNYNFKCKDLDYKPSELIKQINVPKTDKSGFSNRLIQSLQKIPTKYVLFMVEESWLRRGIEKSTLENLINIMEFEKADSIKIHSKLFYYENYRLEPTNYVVNNVRLLKYSQGENFLMNHNACIWNKEYLISFLLENQDPWTNELETSRRMSSVPHNHFHYNIHWYEQPGVSDGGVENEQFWSYAPLIDEMMNMKLKYNI